jgi:glutamate--cysteine ligase
MSDILKIIEDLIVNHKDDLNAWFATKFKKSRPFFYNSVDIRYSGNKIAAVDTNIFPAGFNNLSGEAKRTAAKLADEYLNNHFPAANNILLVPELHTRNLNYLDNITTLKEIISANGKREVIFGSIDPELNDKLNLDLPNGDQIEIQPIYKDADNVKTKYGFCPDLIIVNNDFTAGSPEILQNINQEVIPPVGMGWYQRRKYNHFQAYNLLCNDFAKEFNFDPFLISTEIGHCGKINFKERKGLECIAIGVEKLITRLKKKYAAIGIKEDPYVYIKADRGTYGMGIMIARSGEEIMSINKKTRNKMDIIKSKVNNQEVLLQEGIATIDQLNGSAAEPFIYQIGGQTCGLIIRSNANRDSLINLNAPGAVFTAGDAVSEFNNNLAAYDVIARIASLATIYESDF